MVAGEHIYIYRYSTFVSLFIPHSYSSIWLKGKWNKLHNFFLLSNTVQLSQKTKHECETPSLHRPYNNLPREQGTNSKFWHYLELEVVSKGHTTSSSPSLTCDVGCRKATIQAIYHAEVRQSLWHKLWTGKTCGFILPVKVICGHLVYQKLTKVLWNHNKAWLGVFLMSLNLMKFP